MEVTFFVGSLVAGAIIEVALRYLADVPFPWEFRRRNPNTKINPMTPDAHGLIECLEKLEGGDELDVVMGNMNAKVCNVEPVLKILGKALQKNVKIRIINGPTRDKESEKFLALLDHPNIELFKLNSTPKRHFRIIKRKGKCREVYVEEPHRPFTSMGFRHAKSSRLAEDYQCIFDAYMEQAVPCKGNDFQVVDHSS